MHAPDDIANVYADQALRVRAPRVSGEFVVWRCGLFAVSKTPERTRVMYEGKPVGYAKPWIVLHLRTMTLLADVRTWAEAWSVADQLSIHAGIGRRLDDDDDVDTMAELHKRLDPALVSWLRELSADRAPDEPLPLFRASAAPESGSIHIPRCAWCGAKLSSAKCRTCGANNA